MQRRPEEVVREAVLGMLPKNKLRARRAKEVACLCREVKRLPATPDKSLSPSRCNRAKRLHLYREEFDARA